MTHHHDHDHRPTIYHATSPTCWWSWGYEPVLQRIRLVYGDQVPVHLLYQPVYESVKEYFENYEMDDKEFAAWAEESAETMGVPMFTAYSRKTMAPSAVPPVLAVLLARQQDRAKSERLSRILLRRMVAGGEDVAPDAAILEAVREAGLDAATFQKAWKNKEAVGKLLEEQGEGVHWPHVPLNFYNMVVSDGHRHVVLEHAFDPAQVEEAIDWLGGGELKKKEPKDVAAYLKEVGPAPREEIAKVFRLTPAKAEAELTRLEKAGKAAPVTVGKATFWKPK